MLPRILACAALCALAAASAGAALGDVVVRVVNERGVPLAGAAVEVQGAAGLRVFVTDWRGEVRVQAQPGAQAVVSRRVSPLCAGGGPPPSAALVLPGASGAPAVAVLPAITPAHAKPAVSAQEERLVALVNEERARVRPAGDPLYHEPAPPLRDVASLDRAADTHAAFVEAGLPASWSAGHCGYGAYGPALRAQDAGFTNPANGVGEVMAYASSALTADLAFRLWMGSSGHRSLLMSREMTVAGVALVGRSGVIVAAAGCGAGAPASCETPTPQSQAAPPPPPPHPSDPALPPALSAPALPSAAIPLEATAAAIEARVECVVPAVRGKTAGAARRLLKRAGCRVKRVVRVRASLPAGRVVRTRPRARKRLEAGAAVQLIVSRGRLRPASAAPRR